MTRRGSGLLRGARRAAPWVVMAASLSPSLVARADEGADLTAAAPQSAPDARATAADGALLAHLESALVNRQAAVVGSWVGGDGARRAFVGEAFGEVRLAGPLALRGGAVTSTDAARMRPSLGLRAQVLTQATAGVDGALSVTYRPEGLTEPEGEVEAVATLGRVVGRTTLLGSAAYGQDPEGNERDAELRLAVLRRLGDALFLGAEGRGRQALARDSVASRAEPHWDVVAGPVGSYVVGRFVVSVQVGASAARWDGGARVGALALAGVGAVL